MLPTKRLWLIACVISVPIFVRQAGNILNGIATLIATLK